MRPIRQRVTIVPCRYVLPLFSGWSRLWSRNMSALKILKSWNPNRNCKFVFKIFLFCCLTNYCQSKTHKLMKRIVTCKIFKYYNLTKKVFLNDWKYFNLKMLNCSVFLTYFLTVFNQEFFSVLYCCCSYDLYIRRYYHNFYISCKNTEKL